MGGDKPGGFGRVHVGRPHLHSSFLLLKQERDAAVQEHRSPSNAWDIAWAAVFLASDEARWISGVVLPVDAGLSATTPLAMLEHLR